MHIVVHIISTYIHADILNEVQNTVNILTVDQHVYIIMMNM